MESIEIYRGVKIYKTNDKYMRGYPYTCGGLIYGFRDIKSMRDYVDSTLDSGIRFVTEKGALMPIAFKNIDKE